MEKKSVFDVETVDLENPLWKQDFEEFKVKFDSLGLDIEDDGSLDIEGKTIKVMPISVVEEYLHWIWCGYATKKIDLNEYEGQVENVTNIALKRYETIKVFLSEVLSGSINENNFKKRFSLGHVNLHEWIKKYPKLFDKFFRYYMSDKSIDFYQGVIKTIDENGEITDNDINIIFSNNDITSYGQRRDTKRQLKKYINIIDDDENLIQESVRMVIRVLFPKKDSKKQYKPITKNGIWRIIGEELPDSKGRLNTIVNRLIKERINVVDAETIVANMIRIRYKKVKKIREVKRHELTRLIKKRYIVGQFEISSIAEKLEKALESSQLIGLPVENELQGSVGGHLDDTTTTHKKNPEKVVPILSQKFISKLPATRKDILSFQRKYNWGKTPTLRAEKGCILFFVERILDDIEESLKENNTPVAVKALEKIKEEFEKYKREISSYEEQVTEGEKEIEVQKESEHGGEAEAEVAMKTGIEKVIEQITNMKGGYGFEIPEELGGIELLTASKVHLYLQKKTVPLKNLPLIKQARAELVKLVDDLLNEILKDETYKDSHRVIDLFKGFTLKKLAACSKILVRLRAEVIEEAELLKIEDFTSAMSETLAIVSPQDLYEQIEMLFDKGKTSEALIIIEKYPDIVLGDEIIEIVNEKTKGSFQLKKEIEMLLSTPSEQVLAFTLKRYKDSIRRASFSRGEESKALRLLILYHAGFCELKRRKREHQQSLSTKIQA